MLQEISLIGSILPLAGAALFTLREGLMVINPGSKKLKITPDGATAMVTTGQDQKLDIVNGAGQPDLIISVRDIREDNKVPGKTLVDVYTTANKSSLVASHILDQEGEPVDIAPGITGAHYGKTKDVPVEFPTPIVIVFPVKRNQESALVE